MNIKNKYTDPITGTVYTCKSNMYKAHGISGGFIYKREKEGKTPEEIVLEYISFKNKYTDPITGTVYTCKGYMYKAHGISNAYYKKREKEGKTPEEIVLEYISFINNKKRYTDPITGITYKNKINMYGSHGVPTWYYYKCENRGLCPEEIILGYIALQEKMCNYTDPITGIEYRNKYVMYKAHNISGSYYRKREKMGKTPEEIVLEYETKYTDPITGIEYKNKFVMYKVHDINCGFYKPREKMGKTPEEIVLEYMSLTRNNKYIDPVTGERLSFPSLASRYNIRNSHDYFRKIASKFSIIAALGISVPININYTNINKTKYNLLIEKRVKCKNGKEVFECWIYNEDGSRSFEIMTYEMIDQHCLEQYKKLHNIK